MPKQPKKVIVTFECAETLRDQVQDFADGQDRSASSAIRLALHRMLDNQEAFSAELSEGRRE
jgi:predicted transcriptional regulator